MRSSSILSKAMSCGDSRSKPFDDEASRATITVAWLAAMPEDLLAALVRKARRRAERGDGQPVRPPEALADFAGRVTGTGPQPCGGPRRQPLVAAKDPARHRSRRHRCPSRAGCRGPADRWETSTPRPRGDLMLTLSTTSRTRLDPDRLGALHTGQLLFRDGSDVPPRGDIAS